MIRSGWFVPLVLVYFLIVTFFAGFLAMQKRQIDDKPFQLGPIHLQSKVILK